MKPYPNEELDRMSKREIIRLYKRTVEQFNDAVPVIRCKDCKHYQADDDGIYCDTLGIFGTSPTSYCSFAKRRDDER